MDYTKTFREVVAEEQGKLVESIEDIEQEHEEGSTWTRAELVALIGELEEEDVHDITNLIMDELEEDEDYCECDDDELDEKMTAQAKKKSKIKRKKPAFKIAIRKRKKCRERNAAKLKASKGKNVPYVCGTDGKLHKGMALKGRKLLKKSRKRNKNKITVK